MIGSRWHKVLNDLLGYKTRTGLVVLSIAVGLFAVGTIVSARSMLSTEITKGYAAVNPSSGTVRTLEVFDEDFVRSVRAMEDVEEVDARRAVDARIRVGPDEWGDITVFAIGDYDGMRANKVWPQSGAWPPPEREILIERSALEVIRAEVGDVVVIETADEKRRQLRIAGTVHDLVQLPSQFDKWAYGYVSFETLEWFGEPYGFNELHVVAKNASDKEFARQVVNQVKTKVEKGGFTIPMSKTAEPGSVPLDDILQAVLALMGILGLLSLFLSAFLIVNTISALLAQQKRQIGVMKAIGARTGQIMGMYLGMVTVYGLVALVIAVPLSIVGSRALSRLMASMFNFDVSSAAVPAQAILLQIVIGLMVPVLASLVPFLSNLRITAAEAMSSYGMSVDRPGTRGLGRLLSGENLWFTRLVVMRPILLSLRNTFRSKGRLVLTLATLTLAGAMFVSVFSVRASLFGTIDDLMQTWNYDTMITFDRPIRADRIERLARQVPGVVQADVWLQIPTRHVREDGTESALILFSPRADSRLFASPVMVQGRWLLPEDENAVVVNSIMLNEEPDVQVGDEIVLKIEGRERPWRVVGVSLGMFAPMAYANYPYVARLTGNVGETGAALVATERHDSQAVVEATKTLEAHLQQAGLDVASVQTRAAERSEQRANLGILTTLLMVMAIVLAVVGGLGLMGTMSINVLERTREIGVLRAIGAPNRGVAQVFVLEGIAIGLLSWLLGCMLAVPLGKLLSDLVGTSVMASSLNFSFSMLGVGLWLVVVVVLSAGASVLPARNASRLTVREVLAYE